MLKIRLSRIGKKNKPMYRLTVAENARDPYGKALEILGSYNPYTKELVTKKERIEHWIGMGAQMSPTVNNLLIEKKILEGDKVKASKVGKKEETKEDDKKEEKREDAKTEEKSEEKVTEEKKEEKPAEEKKEEK